MSLLESILGSLPPDHARALEWFAAHESEVGARPWRVHGQSVVAGVSVPLVAQRGIHQPSGWHVALSITATAASVYMDGMRTPVDSDTWVLPYRAHSGREGSGLSSRWNRALYRNCIERIPVGVFLPEGRQYLNLGLAIVESWDAQAGVFLLRGPLRFAQPDSTWQQFDGEPSLEESALVAAEADADEKVLAAIRRRRQQERFRNSLLVAYDRVCAVTGYDAVDALQGAHILAYSGRSSQLVTNGVLMRADVHLLFDRHLLSVNPDDNEIRLSPLIRRTAYRSLEGRPLRLPSRPEQRPSAEGMAVHWAVFERGATDV